MWPFAKFENRESATDAIVTAIQSAAGSGATPSVEALASVEACAGLWSRAFASATVEPQTPATSALTPVVLAAIGRGLASRGEAVFVLDVNGAVELTQASSWKVAGGTRPETWRYAVEMPLPQGGVVKRTLSADAVLHVRYATRPSSPWIGVSPLGMADETRALATWIERRLAEEASTATSYVLPLPESGKVDKLKADIKGGRGRLHIVDTTAAAWGDGTASAPQRDWKSNRLGADPPDSLGKLRSDVRGDVFGAYGIPNTVFGSGGAAREAYRQFLSSTIGPVAKIAVHELSNKLDTPTLAFDFSELRAADIAGRARAYGVLITAGMSSEEAAEATGLD